LFFKATFETFGFRFAFVAFDFVAFGLDTLRSAAYFALLAIDLSALVNFRPDSGQ
jgi:hypothetical protein